MMNDTLHENRNQILADLLSEKSLWAVYVRSRSIPFSKMNNLLGVTFGLAISITSCWSKDADSIADHLAAVSLLAFNTSISLLGFLLAGFSFFATVADKSMFCRMAEVKHKESGLSYLKYNFYVFMRVFYEYSIIALASFAIVVALQSGSGVRTIVVKAISDQLTPQASISILSAALGLLSGCLVYLLMQLKSFIFNVFHVVMTSIRWALEDEYNRHDAVRENIESVKSSISHEHPH